MNSMLKIIYTGTKVGKFRNENEDGREKKRKGDRKRSPFSFLGDYGNAYMDGLRGGGRRNGAATIRTQFRQWSEERKKN